jgi:hypothetical protein
MQAEQTIRAIEREIDEWFETSNLLDVGYEQAVWTLLSMNEDAFLKNSTRLSAETMHVFADNRMNDLTYPLRVCLKRCKFLNTGVRREMIDEDYRLAWEWLKTAGAYSQELIGSIDCIRDAVTTNLLVRSEEPPPATTLLPMPSIATVRRKRERKRRQRDAIRRRHASAS